MENIKINRLFRGVLPEITVIAKVICGLWIIFFLNQVLFGPIANSFNKYLFSQGIPKQLECFDEQNIHKLCTQGA